MNGIEAATLPGSFEREGTELFASEVIEGLSLPQKAIPSRWLYDERGTALEEKVRSQPEHYLRRIEASLLGRYAAEIGAAVGADLARRVTHLQGSTVGGFEPEEAVAVLHERARVAGAGGMLLVGLDLSKDEATLVRAYDDASGAAAAFDLNLLVRINREIGGDFRLASFRHRAVWVPRLSRVETHLESKEGLVASVAGRTFHFREGETIRTQCAYKWEPRAFDAIATIAGFSPVAAWTDERAWYALKLYRVR